MIGKPGRDIPRDRAPGHIAGYAIFCDWSARDLQVSELPMGCGPAKSKDGATTLGPLLVTPDEIEPHRAGKGFALSMTAAVNGEQTSQGRWDSIDWDFADMIAYTSRGTELRPGDVIGSGTVPTGCLFEHYATHPGIVPGLASTRRRSPPGHRTTRRHTPTRHRRTQADTPQHRLLTASTTDPAPTRTPVHH